MAASKFDEKLKKVSFLEDDNIVPIVQDILASKSEKTESIQVQLNIKGYENRKDPTMTKDIVFPHPMKKNPTICIVGTEAAQPHAERLGIPLLTIAEYSGEDKKKAREAAIQNYRHFILCPGYQKAFNLRDILRKRKRTHFICPNVDQIETISNNILKTYRLKVRDWFSVSFPVGHTEMPADEIVENVKYSIQFVADNLKKGPQNVKECFIKRVSGSAIKVY